MNYLLRFGFSMDFKTNFTVCGQFKWIIYSLLIVVEIITIYLGCPQTVFLDSYNFLQLRHVIIFFPKPNTWRTFLSSDVLPSTSFLYKFLRKPPFDTRRQLTLFHSPRNKIINVFPPTKTQDAANKQQISAHQHTFAVVSDANKLIIMWDTRWRVCFYKICL